MFGEKGSRMRLIRVALVNIALVRRQWSNNFLIVPRLNKFGGMLSVLFGNSMLSMLILAHIDLSIFSVFIWLPSIDMIMNKSLKRF